MKTSMKEKVLSEIEKREIVPLSKERVAAERAGIWIVVAVSVLFSIFFLAFTFGDFSEYFGYGARMDGMSPFPLFFWSIAALGTLIIAGFWFRNTATGYRYWTLGNALVWLAVVFLTATAFRWFGFGPMMHSYLIDASPGVSNFIYSASSWNEPENGRMAGTVKSVTASGFVLEALDGSEWAVVTDSAFAMGRARVEAWKKIRVIGTVSGSGVFVADRLMPWFGQGSWMGSRMTRGGMGMMDSE